MAANTNTVTYCECGHTKADHMDRTTSCTMINVDADWKERICGCLEFTPEVDVEDRDYPVVTTACYICRTSGPERCNCSELVTYIMRGTIDGVRISPDNSGSTVKLIDGEYHLVRRS